MLESAGLMVKIEDYDNKVGFSERANVPIEPRLSMQWFLKYPCIQEAADAVADGDITFRPARWAKTYAHWLENIQDWCISRQLWWGHRIPVWYRKDKAEELRNAPALDASALENGSIYVGTEPPENPENWIQDNDVWTHGSPLAVAFLHHGWKPAPNLSHYGSCHRTGHHLLLGGPHDHGRLPLPA
ncbi:MAG: class I tRNA ligase family protein [Akkermansia sp.]